MTLRLGNGELKRGQVLEISGSKAVVQVSYRQNRIYVKWLLNHAIYFNADCFIIHIGVRGNQRHRQQKHSGAYSVYLFRVQIQTPLHFPPHIFCYVG